MGVKMFGIENVKNLKGMEGGKRKKCITWGVHLDGNV